MIDYGFAILTSGREMLAYARDVIAHDERPAYAYAAAASVLLRAVAELQSEQDTEVNRLLRESSDYLAKAWFKHIPPQPPTEVITLQ